MLGHNCGPNITIFCTLTLSSYFVYIKLFICIFIQCVPTGFNIFKFNYSDADNGQNAEADFNISDLDTGGISALETFEIKPDGWLNTKEKLDASIRHEYKVCSEANSVHI